MGAASGRDDQAERRQMLVAWNQTGFDFPQDTCVHQMFEDHARRAPDAAAVAFEGRTLSYGELNAAANRLAHHLRTLGVGPDARVAICMSRAPEMLVALLATVKAGGAYVPLDPAYPAQRLGFMVQDCAPMAALVNGPAHPAFDDALRTAAQRPPMIDLDVDAGQWAQQPASNLDPVAAGLTSGHLAYVIYTSGSTGLPKGVMVEHRSVVNYLSWAQAAYRLGPGAGAPVNTSFAFDATVTSLLGPLASGGRVDLLPEGDRELTALADALEAGRRYALVKLTPSHLQALQRLRPSAARNDAAGAFVIGGEALAAHQVAFWREQAPGIRLINEYGPTEATVGMVVYEVTPDTAHSGSIPIGRPIWNTRIYLLDEQRQPVARGADGEIYIGGAGVARGYLNRPELTAERFIASPFVEGDRLYRTGDLGRYAPDGTIAYLGRIDGQIKISGFRIEPGEIEAVLKRDPAVQDAAVVAREDTPGDRRLVAYVAPARAAGALDALRTALKAALPAYMVPSAFVFLDAFPLTTNGKLDRKALPAPEARATSDTAPVAARTPTEDALIRIWCEILNAKQIGVHDHFFELGGGSLLATRVISRVRKAFQVELKFGAIFRFPVLSDLAGQIDNLVWARTARRQDSGSDQTRIEGQL